MGIQDLKPRSGSDTLRLGDSDELVVMENFGSLPQGELSLDSHGLIVICTGGMAQFDYDGQQIQLRKNDLYLYMAHSVVCNFMSSPDFNCRQIWFSRSDYGTSICTVRSVWLTWLTSSNTRKCICLMKT